ncbi:MAG: EamA family transporter [Dehalococcoidales bacterium]|nr:MAG: EamA family transporter [Dehalococcoidales bacterium]
MIWIPIAITAATITAIVSILDSHLISKRFPSLLAFLAPAGTIHLVIGLVVLLINPLPTGTDTLVLVAAFGSAVVRVVGVLLMLRTMRFEEVSRIMPVVNTFPIFVAILAVPILDEVLGWTEWLAVIITVSGAVLISARWDSERKGVQIRRSFATLMVSSILLGAANIGSKYALDHISFWNMYGVNAACLGAIFLLFSLRPSVVGEIKQMNQRNTALGLTTLNETIAMAGFIMSFWAMEQGPVSMVSTIIGTRPAFVFIYALVLSFFFPTVLNEHFSRGVIITKIVSIGLIIGGVTLLTLGE